jgi:hypothetical protein
VIESITISSVTVSKLSKGQVANKILKLEFEDIVVNNTSVKVYFTFEVAYHLALNEKVAGRLYIKGRLDVKETQQNASEMDRQWKETRALTFKSFDEITRYISFECETRGTMAAYAMDFPSPIPLTRAKLRV